MSYCGVAVGSQGRGTPDCSLPPSVVADTAIEVGEAHKTFETLTNERVRSQRVQEEAVKGQGGVYGCTGVLYSSCWRWSIQHFGVSILLDSILLLWDWVG